MNKYSQGFEADTGKILNIVINSLYSDRDIFLRELLSNASDAIHKRKFLGQTDPAVLNTSEDNIRLDIDKKKKTIDIIDTGIGLDQAELAENLGTIAKSGTSSFLEELSVGDNTKDAAKTLIGQFGVGFYSAFMVAEKVTVTSKKAGTKNTFVWESDGQNGFDISESAQLEEAGTTIKLFLRKDAKDYLDLFKIKSLVKKYSDHITVPINVKDNENDAEQANSAQALWTRSSSSIKSEEYSEFYKSTFGAFDDPYLHIHNKTEGAIDFTNLLFIPKTAPFDLYEPERKTRLSLYINRVFISKDIDGLIPTWLRFVQGILDTSSLDLNVSRELVQNSPILKKIAKSITKRVVSELKKKLKKPYTQLISRILRVFSKKGYLSKATYERLRKKEDGSVFKTSWNTAIHSMRYTTPTANPWLRTHVYEYGSIATLDPVTPDRLLLTPIWKEAIRYALNPDSPLPTQYLNTRGPD